MPGTKGAQEQEEQSKNKSGQPLKILSIDSKRNNAEQYSKPEDVVENENKPIQELEDHSNHVCHNTQGKPVAATQKKLEEYLKPVFKLLRKGALYLMCYKK
ncbi:hypothetical protein PPACK8108_LOCUS1794 [Phakopsora pachyrhizi]|uniref:Uncharacterized protein n=1 Tax=Phakopsora pachyrhizi TaxID=170000 RepID=A0AAV0AGI7_PHAPC|nr:hypothetical protein PPACK8108_LOCUS34 [Phakopsora pachyrhizi]CAH7667402.1 hypothetical protein PPACK8108_LOCUS1794 [Phakopsora pachyrhizi]